VVADEKTHTLQVTKGGFETFTKQFTVKAGGKETVKVRLMPLKVATKKKPSAGTPAKSHYALRFQNSSDYVTLPLKHETAGDLTVEAWVTIDEDSNQPQNYITNAQFFIGLHKGDGKNRNGLRVLRMMVNTKCCDPTPNPNWGKGPISQSLLKGMLLKSM